VEKAKEIFWRNRVQPFVKIRTGQYLKLKNRLGELFKSDRKRKYTKSKMEIAGKATEVLSKIPFIIFVGVSGSVASGWPKKSDDIDFLIICKRDSLWICRIWATILLKINRFKMRNSNREISDSLCLNLWLDETSLTIDKDRQSLLTSLDLVWLKVMLNRQNCWQRLVIANKWAEKYVVLNKSKRQRLGKANVNKLVIIINRLVFWAQYWYMKKKMKGEIVAINKAYFHPKGKICFDRM